MAKLTYAQRKALPSSAFAMPSQRRFPIMDKAHQRNALQRLPQAKGLTDEQKMMIMRKARAKLGKRGKK